MSIQERLKWSRLKSSLNFEDIVSYLKLNSYTDVLGHGFSLTEHDESSCSAIYNEKSKFLNISIDPFGNEFPQEVIEFSTVHFSISKVTNKLFLISVTNPPKSLKKFTDRICGDLDYRIGFGTLDINLKDFLNVLSSHNKVSLLNIKKIKISNVIISSNAKACIEVTAKKNANKEIHLLIKDKEYSLDKIKLSCFIADKISDIEISKSGGFSGPSEQLSFFTHLIIKQILSSES